MFGWYIFAKSLPAHQTPASNKDNKGKIASEMLVPASTKTDLVKTTMSLLKSQFNHLYHLT